LVERGHPLRGKERKKILIKHLSDEITPKELRGEVKLGVRSYSRGGKEKD